MSHHSSQPFETNFPKEFFNEKQPFINKSNFADLVRNQMYSKSATNGIPSENFGLGATNEFPEGKLTENDEGEIRMGITVSEKKVVVDFGKPTHWVGFNKKQAIDFAELIIKRANEITLD